MFLLFDIGGTKLRVARSKDGVSFDKYSIVPTPADFDEGMKRFREMGEGLLEGQKVEAIAGGIAGPILRDKSGLADAKNLPGWARQPFSKSLKDIFGAPVYLDNDTAVVGLGEAHYGAGKGSDILAYITVSTGVGGVRIVHGGIDVSYQGFEPGHQIVDMEESETLCPHCGEAGHLEGYISGRSLERKYGKKPIEIFNPSIWEDVASVLAVGLANSILHWSPDTVVLGGSMMREPGIPLDRVEFYLPQYLTVFPEIPKIKKATLGDLGGLFGGMVLLKQRKAN